MAISPQDALKVTNDEQLTLKKCETFIDEYLHNNFSGGSVIIELSQLSKYGVISGKVISSIIYDYRSVGWEVSCFDLTSSGGKRGLRFNFASDERSLSSISS